MKKKVKCLLVLSMLLMGINEVDAAQVITGGGGGDVSRHSSGNTNCITTLQRSNEYGGGQYINGEWFSHTTTSDGTTIYCDNKSATSYAGLPLYDNGTVYNPRAARALKCNADHELVQTYSWGASESSCISKYMATHKVSRGTAVSACQATYYQCDHTPTESNYVRDLQPVGGKGKYQNFVAPPNVTIPPGKCEPPKDGCGCADGQLHGVTGAVVDESQFIAQCMNECSYGCGIYLGEKKERVWSQEEVELSCGDPTPVICPTPNGSQGSCESTGHYYDLDNPAGHDSQFETLKSCSDGKDMYLADAQISADYCKAYCVEDLFTQFPTTSYSFQAGRYYSIGSTGAGNSWGPIRIYGSRQCRSFKDNGITEGVNTEKLIANYNSAALQEITAYNNWQNNIRHNEAANTAPAHPRNKEHCSETTEVICKDGWLEGDGYCWKDNYYDGITIDQYQKYRTGLGTCPDGYYKEGSICRENEDRWGTWYEPKAYTTYNNYGSASTKYTAGQCDKRDTVDEGSGAYYSARNRRLALENIARGCNEFVGFGYNLNPTVSVNADFDEVYPVQATLTPHISEFSALENGTAQPGINGGGSNEAPAYCAGDTCQMVHYECGGEYCSYSGNKTAGETFAGLNVTSKKTTIQRNINYNLDSTPYRYISKVDGGVLPAKGSEPSGNYLDLGGSVVPISTSVAPGRYYLDLSNAGMGHNFHFDQYVPSSPFMCGIRIGNDIECYECDPDGGGGKDEPNGLDVIYRTIKLGDQKTAFPSIDGDGRQPGLNWESYKENLVAKYITNNRNVKGEAVYSLDPLYSITLTPQRIKEIRTFNQNTNYGDFNLTCKDGRQCISDFIHNTVTVGGRSYDFARYFREAPGTCQNISAAGSNFNSCADK